MSNPENLNFKQLLTKFEDRGMDVNSSKNKQNNRSNNENKLKDINYYRLKQFAHPLSITRKDGDNIIVDYQNVLFADVLKRYYQDKNLRLSLLHAIEKIEVSVKTQICYVLGNRYGAFGYLEFHRWVNKDEYCKHYIKLKEKQFKRKLKEDIKLSNYHDLKNKNNLNSKGFPSVWLAVDVLSYGGMIDLLKLMSKSNLNAIARHYNVSRYELISWLSCLNFIRNSCAHNNNIIDIKLISKPPVRDEWKQYLYTNNSGFVHNNRISAVLLITNHFTTTINPHYNYGSVAKVVKSIIDNKDRNAELLGFKDKNSVYTIWPTPRKRVKKEPLGVMISKLNNLEYLSELERIIVERKEKLKTDKSSSI